MATIQGVWNHEKVVLWRPKRAATQGCSGCDTTDGSAETCSCPTCDLPFCFTCKQNDYLPTIEEYLTEMKITDQALYAKAKNVLLEQTDEAPFYCPPCKMKGEICATCGVRVPSTQGTICEFSKYAGSRMCKSSGFVCNECITFAPSCCSNPDCDSDIVACKACEGKPCHSCSPRPSQEVDIIVREASDFFSSDESMEESVIPESCANTISMSVYANESECVKCALLDEEVSMQDTGLVSCDGCNDKFCCAHYEELSKCARKTCAHLYCPECISYDFELQYQYHKQAYLRSTGKRVRSADNPKGLCLPCAVADHISDAKRRRIAEDS